jgi:hypothetical protein
LLILGGGIPDAKDFFSNNEYAQKALPRTGHKGAPSIETVTPWRTNQ